MNQYVKTLTNGFIKENPTFVLLLGMCPTLATTTSGKNGLMMGLATTFVLICSNLVISLLKKLIPDAVRIPAFIVVIAGFVTVLQLLIQAFLPDLNNSLGIFIPLIVVNCIVLGRAESVASKQNPVLSILDGVSIGLGFTMSLTILGSVREFIGSGKVFEQLIYPDSYGALLFILPPGAFMVLGCLIALFNVITKKS
ncbi:electron transport complex subunit RsxE [Porphyromonas endodontalis]|jgi:electron transport complex, rnfABCDGE type, E subunit|uniref:electron transport complex subunit RsxE n=1 Tax=Porphyromonas endodontalis TaxID=28124 RepID=UPI0023F484F0|nr:electron transport complex subunit E [Porphyromonas endodontalis]